MIGSRPYTTTQRFEYRNPKILAHAKGQACQNCGCEDGTIVAAHSNGAEHGKGRGIKAHDLFVAYLCHPCHYWLDNESKIRDPSVRYAATRADKEEMFRAAMFRTQIILLRDGILK